MLNIFIDRYDIVIFYFYYRIKGEENLVIFLVFGSLIYSNLSYSYSVIKVFYIVICFICLMVLIIFIFKWKYIGYFGNCCEKLEKLNWKI